MGRPKDGTNGQFGLVSPTGEDLVPATPAAADLGDGVPPLTDAFGRIWVRIAAGGGMPSLGNVGVIPTAITQADSVERSEGDGTIRLIVPAAPSKWFKVSAISKSAKAWVMLFNGAAAPVIGASPQFTWFLDKDGGGTLPEADVMPMGDFFADGLSVAVSGDPILLAAPGGAITDFRVTVLYKP